MISGLRTMLLQMLHGSDFALELYTASTTTDKEL